MMEEGKKLVGIEGKEDCFILIEDRYMQEIASAIN
jgi:hypothetical protein